MLSNLSAISSSYFNYCLKKNMQCGVSSKDPFHTKSLPHKNCLKKNKDFHPHKRVKHTVKSLPCLPHVNKTGNINTDMQVLNIFNLVGKSKNTEKRLCLQRDPQTCGRGLNVASEECTLKQSQCRKRSFKYTDRVSTGCNLGG